MRTDEDQASWKCLEKDKKLWGTSISDRPQYPSVEGLSTALQRDGRKGWTLTKTTARNRRFQKAGPYQLAGGTGTGKPVCALKSSSSVTSEGRWEGNIRKKPVWSARSAEIAKTAMQPPDSKLLAPFGGKKGIGSIGLHGGLVSKVKNTHVLQCYTRPRADSTRTISALARQHGHIQKRLGVIGVRTVRHGSGDTVWRTEGRKNRRGGTGEYLRSTNLHRRITSEGISGKADPRRQILLLPTGLGTGEVNMKRGSRNLHYACQIRGE